MKLIDYVPNERAPIHECTHPVRMELIKPGLIEVTIAKSSRRPSGIIVYREVCRCVWPLEAFPEARAEIGNGLTLLLRELVRH